MSNVYTHTFVRNKFLMMELLGFVFATIRLPVVRKVVEYGISNKVLEWLEIYLHDRTTKRAVVTFRIDWQMHEVLVSKKIDDITDEDIPKEEEISSVIMGELAMLFNDFKREKQLTYWYNMGWRGDSADHDAACGITRNGKAHAPVPTKTGTSRSLFHERLRESGISVDIDADE